MSTCQSNPAASMTVSLREMRMVFERLLQVTRIESGLVPSLRDCALYSAALGLGGFARLPATLDTLGKADPHALSIDGLTIDCGHQHAWLAADAIIDVATESLRTGGEGIVTVHNAADIGELRVVEALAQRFGLKATVRIDAAAATIAVAPATNPMEIALLDTIRRDGVAVDAAHWWTLYHRSAEALAPDSYLSRRHAGPIIVEADGKVIGRQDEDETDFSLLLADAPGIGSAAGNN
ncbi:MAG: hypothetical protein QM684_13050 [Rhizobium sp.]